MCHPPPQCVPEEPRSPTLQCRHSLSAELSSAVPLVACRAPGSTLASTSAEDLSSLSSCHSTLGNIQPPSVASPPSEVALAYFTDSVSEAIRAVVGPAGLTVRAFADRSRLGMEVKEILPRWEHESRVPEA